MTNSKDKLIFFYRIFGLVVESGIECPELAPALDFYEADIRIGHASLPAHLDHPLISGNWIEGNHQKILLTIEGVARYLIKGGKDILVDAEKNTAPADIRLFLLGSAMGAILHQRGMLPFHGSTICASQQAYTFSGESGIGKSTLAAALVSRGYQMLADDVSAFTFSETGIPLIHPGMPQLKLCKDVLQQLGIQTSQVRPLGTVANKYGFMRQDAYVDTAMPSASVYILGRHPDNKFACIPLKGMDKFQALKSNTYRPFFVKAMGLEKIHFDLLRKLASHIRVQLVLRPKDPMQVEQLADYIISLIHGKTENDKYEP